MNYKPLVRKNKRFLKDLSATMVWLFILVFLIHYSARAQVPDLPVKTTWRVPTVGVAALVKTKNKLPQQETVGSVTCFKKIL